jgi:hypothetical protein
MKRSLPKATPALAKSVWQNPAPNRAKSKVLNAKKKFLQLKFSHPQGAS